MFLSFDISCIFFSLMFAGVNRQPKSVDTYLALPRNSLGIGYVGASYTANIRSQIGIVGTLDDTRIRVALPNRNNEPDFAVTVEHNGNINYMPYTRKFVWANVSHFSICKVNWQFLLLGYLLIITFIIMKCSELSSMLGVVACNVIFMVLLPNWDIYLLIAIDEVAPLLLVRGQF